MFWKENALIIAKFLGTDLVLCTHSREGKSPSYGRMNTINSSVHKKVSCSYANLKDCEICRYYGRLNTILMPVMVIRFLGLFVF